MVAVGVGGSQEGVIVFGVGAFYTCRGIVRGAPQWIVQESVEPLLELMKDRGVDRLVSDRWSLVVDGVFANPHSETHVFNGMNNPINPFFQG